MDFVTDARGRKLYLRKLTVMDQVRLLRAIGPVQSSNETYVNIVTMASGVSQIDDVPCILPNNEARIDAAIERIGDEGFAALMVQMKKDLAALQAAAEDAAGERPDPLAPSA
jgi:hypothetical protein